MGQAKGVGRIAGFASLGWIDRQRLVVYSGILLLASLVSIVPFFQAAQVGQGSDFLAFWSGGRMAWEGHAERAYDMSRLQPLQASAGPTDFYAFVNPPPFFFAVLPLGPLSYPVAWIVWIAATYAIWFLIARRLFPRLAWPAAAYPGALVAAWHAQTGFLTSAFQGGAALLLRRRPFAAGLCVGALIVKPHLALLFPVAFLAGRHWRAVLGAAVGVIALCALSVLAFGMEVLPAYTQSWAVSRYLVETGSDVFFMRQCTVYALARLIAGAQAAAVAQTIVSIAMVAATWAVWRREVSLEGKLAFLFAATPLATPYLFNYDLPFLIFPTAWLASRARANAPGIWLRPVVLLFYLSPLVTRAFALPLGMNLMPVVLAGMLWLIGNELRAEAQTHSGRQTR